MKVIIAEKPSVAKDIARVLNISQKKDGYFENETYCITWAFGHLIELASPEFYGCPHKWNKDVLPIIPEKFILNCRQVKVDGKSSNDLGVEKQINTIKNLFAKCESIIVATDAGREGELIFRYIYDYVGCQKPFKRLWISSMTDKAILEGFKNLKSGKEYDSLYQSAKARSEADWLVGINATQSLSLSVNRGLLSLGRVQTPTLALICKRFIEHTSFKSKFFYIVNIQCNKLTALFQANLIENEISKHFDLKEQANTVVADLGELAKVIDVKVDSVKEPPPLLYDLTSLQQDANKQHGISAQETLDAAQKLYELKLTTYPRTGSRYVSEDVFETYPSLIAALKSHDCFKAAIDSLKGKKLNKRSVNDSKVTDHHALLPTGNDASKLDSILLVVYNLITGRLLESISEDCKKLTTTVKLAVSGRKGANYVFLARETKIIEAAWRGILNITEEDKEDNQVLPVLKEGETLAIEKKEVKEQKTKPKALLTEATLLKEMENCGKEIEDEELKAAMKEGGLGTPATRAATIETLFGRKYIDRQKKSLIPTDLGLMVYTLVKDKKISQPLLTGEWEKKLEDIRHLDISYLSFLEEIKGYTKELTSEMLSVTAANLPPSKNNVVCPKCGKGHIVIRENAAGCSEYKSGCDFTIWRTIAKKKITDVDIEALINKGHTKVIKGFTSKLNKPFDAFLKFDDSFKVEFGFAKK